MEKERKRSKNWQSISVLNICFKKFERVSERLPYWTSAAYIHLSLSKNILFPLIFLEDQTIINGNFQLRWENWTWIGWILDISGDCCGEFEKKFLWLKLTLSPSNLELSTLDIEKRWDKGDTWRRSRWGELGIIPILEFWF